MLQMLNTLGLGFILSARNDITPAVRGAEMALRNLVASSGRTKEQIAEDWKTIAATAEMSLRSLKVGFATILGGAIMATPFAFAGLAAAASEDRMAAVESLLVGTGVAADVAAAQVRQMHESILDMAGDTRIPLKDLETATYDLVSANLTVAEATGALPATAKLAVAGMGSMQQAVDGMTASLNTFGKTWGDSLTPMQKGERIANAYAATIASLKTTLPKLQQGMAYAAGPANVLGASIEETTVLLGLLQTKGLEASRSGTAVSAMFRELINLGTKSKALQGPLAGLQLADAEGSLRPVADIIADIEQRLAGLGSVRRGEILSTAFGDEGRRALDVLIGQSEALRELVHTVETSNALGKMTESRQRSAIALYRMMKNEIHATAVELGTMLLPLMRPVIQALRQMVGAIHSFTQQHPMLTRIFVVLGVGASTVLILGGAMKMLNATWLFYKAIMPTVMSLTAGATFSFGALAASVWAALWPILAVIGALAGLIKLIDIIAGTDMFGGIVDFITGRDLMPQPALAISGMPMAQPLAGPEGGLAFGGGYRQSRGGDTIYEHNRYVTNINADAKMGPKDLARTAVETQHLQRQSTQRRGEGDK